MITAYADPDAPPYTEKVPPLTHRELVMAMAEYARPHTWKGLALFLSDAALYVGAICAVLFAPSLILKILASLIAGVKLANLATLAHDGAHNSLTASRRLNWLLSVLAFMPCLFNYRLWVYDHHALHHPHTNGEHVDSYQPLSKDSYDALPSLKKWWYRFSRTGNPLAFGTYYIVQRWWQVKLVPRSFLPQDRLASAWRHFGFLSLYFAAFIGLLLAAPNFAPVSSLTAVLLGFIVPFFVFQTLLAFSLYVNHTHPDIPWFDRPSTLRATLKPEFMTVHLRFPKWFSTLAHNFYDHPAHHTYPAIPCYELGKAQAHMNHLLGHEAVVVDFSLRSMAEIFSKCKLYDYANYQWLDFDGRATTPTSKLIIQQRKAMSPSGSC
ncbi:fatty acid desaturase family protein [Noviherbaspirillum saxi]|uniref:Fatty acid desaturase domain-containing protein n=1 Tax=Noviherbaspirillum saxi TaxID=2320863 RepID=A0A3A3FGF1_9BURK|nr:fatty acid desaturase [Noviherbaspirillum saxi]RJF92461.1 hypothetical protein D3871_28015 [Noviherbaspirillum saxi]